ncbi:MAG: hypothetical protein ACRD8A_12975, partial [Candidatus Acidiferrales bacterium]
MSALSPDRWREVSPYLDRALGLSEIERAKWIESLRAEKPELVDLLEELLREHRVLAAEHFLEESPPSPLRERSWAGQVIGAYTLVEPIGHGGMGSVWLARRSDGRFHRRVAVKLLNLAVGAADGLERFKR